MLFNHARSFVYEDAFALLLGDTILILECPKELVKNMQNSRRLLLRLRKF